MKVYGVLRRVVGDKDVVVAESVYGVHAIRSPAIVPTRQEAEELLGWCQKADWAVRRRPLVLRTGHAPAREVVHRVEIDVPGEFLTD